MTKERVLTILDNLKIKHPNYANLSDSLDILFDKNYKDSDYPSLKNKKHHDKISNNFILISSFKNDALTSLIFDWNYYPFLNKEQTFKDLNQKNFFNLDNKDFFVFDANNKQDEVFATKLWYDSIIEYLENHNPFYGRDYVWQNNTNITQYEVQEFYTKQKFDQVLAPLKSFIKKCLDEIKALLKLAKNIYQIKDTFMLKDFIYDNEITNLSNLSCDVLKLYKDSIAKHRQEADYSYVSLHIPFLKQYTFFSFEDLCNEQSCIYQIIQSFYDVLLNFELKDLSDIYVYNHDCDVSFISFCDLFNVNFYNKIKNSLIFALNQLFDVYFSSLKPLKHTSFVLNEVTNNYLKDSIHNIIKQDDYIIYKNALKFYNIAVLISHLDKYLIKDEISNTLKQEQINDILKTIPDDPNSHITTSNTLYHLIHTSKQNLINWKNPINPSDDLQDIKNYNELPFIFSNVELENLRSVIWAYLRKTQTPINNFQLLRSRDDAIYTYADSSHHNWISLGLNYDLNDESILNTELSQPKNVSYGVLDRTNFNDLNNQAMNIFTKIDENRRNDNYYLRRMYLIQFFINNEYKNYSLFFASLNYNAFNVSYPSKINYYQCTNDALRYDSSKVPLLKPIDLNKQDDRKNLQDLFSYYSNMTKTIYALRLNWHSNFYLANFNEDKLNIKNQYKTNNAYEKELERASKELLEQLNGQEVIINNETTNSKIRR